MAQARPGWIERRLRRGLAEAWFFGRALRTLAGPGVRLLLCWLGGAAIEHWLGGAGGGEGPGWLGAIWDSYRMMMGELPDDLPDHWLAQAMVYVQPILGIFFLAEGLLKLGFEVFDKEHKKEDWMNILASSSRGHVVLCGLGSVGFRTLEELIPLGEQVFIVERRADNLFLDQARAMGAHVIIGDARTENLLRGLNVAAARAVLIVTDDDLANLEIAMDVREMAPHVSIVMRLYDQKLANKVKATLGVQVSFSTSKLAAPLLASAAFDPGIVGTHRVGDQLVVVIEIVVSGTGALAGRTVLEVGRDLRLGVVALHRGGAWELQPIPERVLTAGDRVQIMVPGQRVAELHRLNSKT